MNEKIHFTRLTTRELETLVNHLQNTINLSNLHQTKEQKQLLMDCQVSLGVTLRNHKRRTGDK